MTNWALDVMKRPANGQERLSASIRREIGSEVTTRFLRALPAFAAADPLPSYWRQLLDRLRAKEDESRPDEAERAPRSGR